MCNANFIFLFYLISFETRTIWQDEPIDSSYLAGCYWLPPAAYTAYGFFISVVSYYLPLSGPTKMALLKMLTSVTRM